MRQRLQAVQTSKRLVNESDACARRAEEELVIVSVEVSVEGSQLGWCQVGIVRWFVVLVLNIISLIILSHQLVTQSRTMTFFSPLSSAFSLSVPVLSGLNM